MTIHNDPQRLERLERELADAFDVSPSPDLVPRIREQLAEHEARPRISVLLTAACACAVLGLAAVLALYPAGGSERVQGSPAPAHVERPSAPAVAPPDDAVIPAAPRSRSNRRARLVAVVAPPENTVRPSSDLSAIQQFMTALETGAVDPGSLAETPKVEIQVAEFSITPLTIPPLAWAD